MAQVRYIRWEIMETRDFHEAHSVGNNSFIAPETSSAMTRQAVRQLSGTLGATFRS